MSPPCSLTPYFLGRVIGYSVPLLCSRSISLYTVGEKSVFPLSHFDSCSHNDSQVVPDGFGVAYMTGYDGGLSALYIMFRYSYIPRSSAVYHYI